jgi:hypothetical protein
MSAVPRSIDPQQTATNTNPMPTVTATTRAGLSGLFRDRRIIQPGRSVRDAPRDAVAQTPIRKALRNDEAPLMTDLDFIAHILYRHIPALRDPTILRQLARELYLRLSSQIERFLER